MKKVEIREITKADLIKQDEYFVNSPDSYLINLGVDPEAIKAMPALDYQKYLSQQSLPPNERTSYALALYVNDAVVGMAHTRIHEFGKLGELHWHLFDPESRRQGFASQVFREVLKRFFDLFKYEIIFCTPNASNEPVNAFMRKQGLEVKSSYITPAAGILLERTCNRYEITPEFLRLN